MQGGSPTGNGDGGVANLAGSTGCRRDLRSKERHGHGNGKHQEPTLGIGDPGCGRYGPSRRGDPDTPVA